jgi:hypothetical protein
MDRGRDQRDREQGKASGCDGRRKSGRDHRRCPRPVSRESCTGPILAIHWNGFAGLSSGVRRILFLC